MLYNFVKTAWRNIARHKGYSFINIVGLALGICGALVIFLVTTHAFSFNSSFVDKSRIYRIVATQQDIAGKTDGIGFTINPLPAALRTEFDRFETVTGFHHYYASVLVPGVNGTTNLFNAAKRGEALSPIIIAGPDYFNVFQYQWLVGDPLRALSEPYKVVLTSSKAIQYFGRQPLQTLIGKTIIYRDIYMPDSLVLQVTGVVADHPGNTDLHFTDFISFSSIQHSFLQRMIQLDHWANWNPNGEGYVKLKPGVQPEQLKKQLAAFAAAHIPPYPGHTTVLQLQPLADVHFNSNYRDLYTGKVQKPTLFALMGIAAFILLIAAVNFINLSTAQAVNRAKEIGVRKVMGSSKSVLRMQFLVETFIIVVAALLMAILLLYPAMAALRGIVPDGAAWQFLEFCTVIFLLGVAIATTFLAGFYPAKILSGFQPASMLRGSGGGGALSHTNWLRQSLIVFQFSISLVFIIGTLVAGDQLQFIMHKDLGFAKENIITLQTGYNQPRNKVQLLARALQELPAVTLVSQHMETPAAKSHSNTNLVRTDMPDMATGASYEMCDENYLPLFALTLIAGRNILHSDTVRELLINETAVRQLHYKNAQDAIGKPVRNGMNEATGLIVGVVKDFHSKSLHEPIESFFISSDRGSEIAVSIKVAGAPLAAIEKTWRTIYPNEPFNYRFFDDTIARLYINEQNTSKLLNVAMVMAIFISCIGLFGLSAFNTAQRGREVAIRKVLGASVHGILMLLTRDFLLLVLAAGCIAVPLAWLAMNRWLADFAYRISISPLLFFAAAGIAVVPAILAIGYHTLRAAFENPVRRLRSE